MRVFFVTALLSLIAITANASEPHASGVSCSLQTMCGGHPWKCQDCTTCCNLDTSFIAQCDTTCH